MWTTIRARLSTWLGSAGARSPLDPTWTGNGHVRLLGDDGVDEETRRGLGAAWQDAGRRAHAGIERAALQAIELSGVGAPPELVNLATDEMRDAVRSARVCFALATAIGGELRAESLPAAARELPRRRDTALATLAAGALMDGAFAMGAQARTSAKLARRATPPEIRAALEELARAEARRSTNAWLLVRWCASEGGEVVRREIAALSRRVAPLATPRAIPQVACDGGWERWGIAGDALVRQERVKSIIAVERRVAGLTDAAAPSHLVAA